MWWILGYFGMAVITAFVMGWCTDDDDVVMTAIPACFWPLALPIGILYLVGSAGVAYADQIKERRREQERLAYKAAREQERAAREVDRLLKSEGVL